MTLAAWQVHPGSHRFQHATRMFHHVQSISEISSCFFGPRPWHIEIRHRVKQTSTINLFGFETQIENSKIEIMESDCSQVSASKAHPPITHLLMMVVSTVMWAEKMWAQRKR